MKDRFDRIQAFKETLQERRRRAAERPVCVRPFVEPRYDEVYFRGLEWLDGLAGNSLPEGLFTVEIESELEDQGELT